MKKILLLLPILLFPEMAVAALQCSVYLTQETCSSSHNYTVYGSDAHSSAYSATCYVVKDFADNVMSYSKFFTNLTCNANYAKTSHSAEHCVDSTTNVKTLTYYDCQCSESVNYSNAWSAYSTGVQRDSGTRISCSSGSPVSSTAYRYRCASGYYSASGQSVAESVSALNCTVCPANATCASDGLSTFQCNAGYYKDATKCTSCAATCGVGHTTGSAGATAYTQCYADAGVDLTDSTGTFQYTASCCCDETCAEKCTSGKSCVSSADCGSGARCADGCCSSWTVVCLTQSCSSAKDCGMGQTCDDGCCSGGNVGSLCAVFSDNYCLTNADCASGSCNLNTHCCLHLSMDF